MRFLRPRSLSGLILLGFALVSMPLLAGVVSAALNITRLSASSERLVLHGVEATRYTQAIVRQVAAMERSARLFQLLGRTELLDVFHENRRRMDTVLAALERLPGDARRRGLIDELRRQTASIANGLESTGRADVAAALRAFGPLSQTAGQLSVLASRQIDRELIRLQDDTERTRRRLLWQSAALVPISLGFAFVFTLLLGRPIRDIDEAIRKLGHGELAEPIKVKGTTDLEALGRQIEWLRQRLLEVSEERERFLRHMSHELKTPLANIREGTELLLDGSVGALSQGQSEVTGILRENSLNLQRLIENLLSYSAWQAQARGLSLVDVDLGPLARFVVENQHLSVTTKRLQLNFEIAPLQVRADRAKLRLILENLLSNAIKFTPQGGTVLVRARGPRRRLLGARRGRHRSGNSGRRPATGIRAFLPGRYPPDRLCSRDGDRSFGREGLRRGPRWTHRVRLRGAVGDPHPGRAALPTRRARGPRRRRKPLQCPAVARTDNGINRLFSNRLLSFGTHVALHSAKAPGKGAKQHRTTGRGAQPHENQESAGWCRRNRRAGFG